MQKLQLRQNQSQKLSPQQIQFIKLLQLSNSNIEAEIKKEIEENPALEENEKNENIALATCASLTSESPRLSNQTTATTPQGPPDTWHPR